MKKSLYFLILIVSAIGFSQDVIMEDGTFNRCAPDKFFDSGGEFGNYGNNENFITTICPQNADEFIVLNFTLFTTQLGASPDTMNIYDGDDISAPLIGSYSGTNSPSNVSSSTTNTSGCLTVEFISDDGGSLNGWEADILCAVACQDIVASIDSTIPVANGSGVITILPGESVDFSGSATFSLDDSDATYEWDFGDGNTALGTDVTNMFTTFGTYTVTLTVTDNNPQACSDTATISVVVLGPNLVVDQTTFTIEQLVEDVLINSDCASVSNIIASTGINFSPSEPNGIGYFISNGVDFPFEDGVLLTSGNASEAAGPNGFNTIGAGTGIWPGDADLDAVAGTGTTNATFIQFDFTPLADSISFEFLMASEEYDMGSFECTFSDAFAFLLTDSNGVTTNLAVIPDTTTPILVTNIHPFNGACPAINEEFFGGYTPAGGPPIAFDGRTTVFTAQSEVIPGENYTIKLVIGDDGNGFGDTILDSGVFLKAGSFDLGGDLGEDITIAAGTAECGGTPVILDTGVTTATHTWYFEGVEIPDETGSSISVDETGTYSVDIVFTGVCQSSDEVFVEFRTSPTASPAQDLVGCSSVGVAEFNLSENDDNILGTQNATDFVITYHLTQEDAIDNVGPLPSNYTNVSNPQVIWARMSDITLTCFDTTSFSLSTPDQPIINPVPDLELCDDISNDGISEFNLELQTAGILGTQSSTEFNVSYHLSFVDADSGSGALPSLYTNVINSEPIFVRVEGIGDSNCYNASATAVFNLIVNPTDDASFTVTPTCDGATTLVTGLAGGTFTFDPVPTDGAIINPITGLVTGGTLGVTYTIVYTTTGLCTSTSFQTFNVLDLDDASFTITPTCDGGVADVTGVPGGTFSFNPVPTDGAVIDAVTGSVTNGTPGETYTVAYLTNGTCPNSSTVEFTASPLPLVIAPTPLSVCDDGVPDGLTELDLSIKDSEITDNNASYAVSYYLDLADANSGMNVLPTLYTNTSNGQIIIARVEDTTTGCYATTTLELLVEQAPAAITPEPMRYCDPDNDGFGVFTLTDADDDITGGALGLIVTYHETEANANSNTLALDTTVDYNNISVNTQTLYARVESQTITTNCATIVELELIVEPSPQILEPTALVACDIFSADGFEAFDLTSSSAEVLNGQNPLQYIISYYESEADAASAIGAIANPLAYTNTVAGNQIIWIRVEDNTTIAGCYKLTSLELIVNPLPEAVAPTPLELCDDLGEIPGDELRLFDLTVKDSEITGSNGSWTTAYYETNADAQAQMNAIPDPTQYTNSSVNGLPANPQTLYVVVTDSDTGCVDFTTLTIRVLPNPTPTPSDQLPDLELCDTVNTGDGVEVFNLLGLGNDNAQADLILNGEQQVTLSYHETAEAADMGTDAIADPENFQNTESPDQRIYVRMSSNSTDCYAVVDFTIRVNPLPEVVAVTDFIQCELNTDGSASFDLRSKDEEVLNGQDPTEFIVTYHDNLADAESQANALASPYNNTSNPQEIFVTITNTITGCSISTQRFNVQVDEAAQANPDMAPITYEACDDTLETDGDPDNDSVQFDLSTQDDQVLDGQDSTNYIVTYYSSEVDATLNVNPLPNLYENSINPQVIYARVDNNTPDVITGNDTSICFEVAPLTLQVNPLPNFNLEDSYILCINTNGTEVLSTPILDTGLSVADYSFEWSYNGAVIPTATASALTPTQGGTYSVIVTDTSSSTVTSCTTMDTAEVIESAPPMLTAEVVTQLFGETNVIEAVATGLSDAYEYSLDGGPWQDSGLFTDVSPGLRLITARDKIGCGIATVEVLVIDYPLYFTPNGDGNNDTWNIAGIGSEAKIYIFDRYGKLIKQISPTGQGWNGTFNGSMMPTSDYWFTVLYNEPQTGNQKEFKAHFTLKR